MHEHYERMTDNNKWHYTTGRSYLYAKVRMNVPEKIANTK